MYFLLHLISEYFLNILKDYLLLLPFYLLFEFFILRYYKKKQILFQKGFIVGFQIFLFFITAVLYITGTACISDIGKYGSELIRPNEINLVPFFCWGIGSTFGFIMNIVLFIPIGFLPPLLWEKGTTFGKTVLSGFVFSLLVELSQLFNFRATDIDDLFTNTLGTILGFALYYLLFKRMKLFKCNNNTHSRGTKNVALLTILSIFLFHFLIGSPLIRLFWLYIYNN